MMLIELHCQHPCLWNIKVDVHLHGKGQTVNVILRYEKKWDYSYIKGSEDKI